MWLVLVLQFDKAKVIQTLLFVTGVNTLMQTIFGTRLPSVISSSYAFLIPTTSIIQARRYQRIEDPHEVGLTYLASVFFLGTIFLKGLVLLVLLVILVFGISDDFSAVCRDNERDTGCSYCYFSFPDDDWFPRLLEKCCKVPIYLNKNPVHSLFSLQVLHFLNSELSFWFRFLTPLSVVPLVSFTGLGLYYLAFPMVRHSKLSFLPFYVSGFCIEAT